MKNNFCQWLVALSLLIAARQAEAQIPASDNSERGVHQGFPLAGAGQVTIATSASPVAGGTTAGGKSVAPGTSVTVTAHQSKGFLFVNWTVGGVIVSTQASYKFEASTNEALVANFANFLVTTGESPTKGGTATGGGFFINGANVTVTAVANDCYEFTDWTVGTLKVTQNPYTFTATKTEALKANFTQVEYTNTTHSSPTNGGTVSGGGKTGCGDIVTLKATPKPGFAFTGWTVLQELGFGTNANPYKFEAGASQDYVAHFRNIKPPILKITAPTPKESIGTAAFILEGTASDNVGVAGVYYNLNGTGWQLASNEQHFAFWYAYVTLAPNSANTVSAYAVDTSTNFSTTNTVTFASTATGLAPLSISGQLAELDMGTNISDTNYVSFDSAVYVKFSTFTNNGSEVGTYTYTPTGPDTAEFVPQRVLPTPGSNATVLKLTFSNAYTATYANISDGSSGTFRFQAAEESVPPSLDGLVAVTTSYNFLGYQTTNTFGSDSFAVEDNQGATSSGTYSFTPFTLVDAYLVQAYTNPSSRVGTTNYLVFMFTEGASPPSGYYASEILDASGAAISLDTGTFTTTSNKVATKFVGPITTADLQATIKPAGEPKLEFTRSYGRGTFASIFTPTAANLALIADDPNDVGIQLSNPRITADTGVSTFTALAPPYAVGVDDETVDAFWESATSATVSNVDSGTTAALTYSKAENLAPAALSGHTLTAMENGKSSTFAFKYNNVIGGGNAAGTSGTYTYAPYTSVMALATLTSTGISNAGEVQYVLLYFKSADSGTFVNARPNALNPGSWTLKPGTFTMK